MSRRVLIVREEWQPRQTAKHLVKYPLESVEPEPLETLVLVLTSPHLAAAAASVQEEPILASVPLVAVTVQPGHH